MYHNGGEQIANHHFGNAVQTIYHFGKLVWEAINGFIFTKNGRALMTKSGRMIKTKSR